MIQKSSSKSTFFNLENLKCPNPTDFNLSALLSAMTSVVLSFGQFLGFFSQLFSPFLSNIRNFFGYQHFSKLLYSASLKFQNPRYFNLSMLLSAMTSEVLSLVASTSFSTSKVLSSKKGQFVPYSVA